MSIGFRIHLLVVSGGMKHLIVGIMKRDETRITVGILSFVPYEPP